MKESTHIAQAVKALREKAGLSVRAAAQETGIGDYDSFSTYRHYESGFKGEFLPIIVARQLVKGFVGKGSPPITEEDVMKLALPSEIVESGALEPNARWAEDVVRAVAEAPAPHDLPVHSTSQGGPRGAFWLKMSDAINRVPRPPGLAGARNAFALYVEGDTMSPWKEAGQKVYINPDRPASANCYVLVEFRPENESEQSYALIKKLIKRTDDNLELRQYNPPLDFSVSISKVAKVYRILEDDELFGI